MIGLTPDVALCFDCDVDKLDPALRTVFRPLSYDGDTRVFVEQVMTAPHGRLSTALYSVLRRIVSDYDAYGILGMYPMHLVSRPQLEQLLPRRGGHLLDVGAGDGGVTRVLASCFDRVTVTERSAVLRRRLRFRGFDVADFDAVAEPWPTGHEFDAIACLNVLDRTGHPRTMLDHLIASLKPGGLLLLALPLPVSTHVQAGGYTVDPEETLPETQGDWEAGANAIFRKLLVPRKLSVHTLSRVPYLCKGDAHRSIHILDDAFFVCRLD